MMSEQTFQEQQLQYEQSSLQEQQYFQYVNQFEELKHQNSLLQEEQLYYEQQEQQQLLQYLQQLEEEQQQYDELQLQQYLYDELQLQQYLDNEQDPEQQYSISDSENNYQNIYLIQKDRINELIQQIQLNKPYLNFISISYITMKKLYDVQNNYFIKQLLVQVFDQKQKIYKSLKIEFLENNQINFDGYQDIIDKYKYFNIQNSPEIETIRKIHNLQDIQLDDIYLIKLNDQSNFIIYEIEQIDLPYQNFTSILQQENEEFQTGFINRFIQNLSQRYENLDIKLEDYYVKISDENEIQFKSFLNVKQSVEIQYFDKNNFGLKEPEPEYLYTYLPGKIIQKVLMSKNDLQNSYRKQLKQIEKKVKIEKQNMIKSLKLLAPSLMKLHPKKLFEIIQQHPKYLFYSLIDFDKEYVIFKVYNKNQKHLLKLKKFDTSSEAKLNKNKYESLKQFQQENEGIFFEIGECLIIYASQTWYVSFEENVTPKQKNAKLISFKKIDKILKYFKDLKCQQVYIFQYLIVSFLIHQKKIFKSGFQSIDQFNYQPYIYISDMNKISSSKIILSNPFINNYKWCDIYMFDIIYCDVSDHLFIFDNNQKILLDSQIFKRQPNYFINTKDDQYTKSKLQYIFNQIQKYFLFYEQYPNLSTDSLLLNQNFKIIQNVKLENFIEKNGVQDQFVQFKRQMFTCSLEQIQICQRYLYKSNNIQYLEIRNSSKLQNQEFYQLKEINNGNFEKQKLQSDVAFFKNVKELYVYDVPQIYMDQSINQQLLPSLENVEIENQYYQHSIENIFERLNQQKNIFSIFENVKIFKNIKIDMNIFRNWKSYDFVKIYKFQENKQKFDKQQEISLIMENIETFLHLNYMQNDDVLKKIKQYILEILSIYQCIRCESLISNIENDVKQYYLLLLKFKDISEFNLGEIEIYFKLNMKHQLQIKNIPLKIEFFKCRNQQRMKNENYKLEQQNISNLLKSWLYNELEEYFKYNLLGKVSQCKCNEIYHIKLKIYKGQKKLKYMTLYIQNYECSLICSNNFYEEVGLSQGNQFTALQELTLIFQSQKQYDQNRKDIFKIINKNKSINTIKYAGIQTPKSMLKLTRVVKFQSSPISIYSSQLI